MQYGDAGGALDLVVSDIRLVDCALQTAPTIEQHRHNLPLQTIDRYQVDNQGHEENDFVETIIKLALLEAFRPHFYALIF